MTGNDDRRATVRIAAVGDLHCPRTAPAALKPVFEIASQTADILLLAGDLTDRGTPEEAHLLAREVTASARIPVVAVLGNHDHEGGAPDQVRAILTEAGIAVLDGDAVEIRGVGIAGVKGFLGGFGRGALQPWGEEMVKRIVREAVDESLKLETALAKLRVPQRIALLHYSPIAATVEGEPLEIWSYLGSSRLEEPIGRYPVAAVFHGHAHHGAPEGLTRDGIPVYNVAMPLLARIYPDRPPFRLIELPADAGALAPASPNTTPAAAR